MSQNRIGSRVGRGGVDRADRAALRVGRVAALLFAQLAALVAAITVINTWNRLSVTVRKAPGHYTPGDYTPAGDSADSSGLGNA